MAPFLYALTLSNINRFSKLFYCQNQDKFVIILSLKIPRHLKCVAILPCKMSSILKATTEKNTILPYNTFSEINNRKRNYSISYCVQQLSHHAVFTARRYAKRGICRRRVSVSLCVCLCVCLSHSGIVSKRLNVGSRK